jgi:hypothetical protein
MTTRDQEEQDLRIEQMTINIDKLHQEQKWEIRKFVLQTFVAAIAAIGVGVGIGNLIWAHREPLPPPPPQTIILQQPAPPPAPLKPPP